MSLPPVPYFEVVVVVVVILLLSLMLMMILTLAHKPGTYSSTYIIIVSHSSVCVCVCECVSVPSILDSGYQSTPFGESVHTALAVGRSHGANSEENEKKKKMKN